MALKAEGAALDCFEVTLKCEEAEDEDEAVVVAVIPRPEPMLRVAQQEKTPPPRPSLLEAGGNGCEEPKLQMTWEQEFLVGNSPEGSGRALCMVCGAEIQFPSADTARAHILEQHPHTLDLSPSEKSNILEAWSEGVALLQDVRAEQPSPPNSDSAPDVSADPDSAPDPARMPAEIVVLLDSEDSTVLPRRTRPRGLRPLELPVAPATEPVNKKPRSQRWKEPPEEEPVRKKRGRSMTKNLDPDPDPDPDSDSDPLSPDSPTEAFTAPPEVRHFTDGSFPPGFVLQLFSHTQLRAADGKDAPREGQAAEGGLPPLESPSPGTGLAVPAAAGRSAAAPALSSSHRMLLPQLSAELAPHFLSIFAHRSPFGPSRDTGSPGYPGGWRSPRQSASYKIGPSIPRAPRVWEQVTPQTARGFVGISTTGGGEKQGVVYRFLLPGEGMEEAVSLGFSELPLCHLMKSAKPLTILLWRSALHQREEVTTGFELSPTTSEDASPPPCSGP